MSYAGFLARFPGLVVWYLAVAALRRRSRNLTSRSASQDNDGHLNQYLTLFIAEL